MGAAHIPKKHLSVFSGIGGFDLAASNAGWQNMAQVEINAWCQRVLKKNFPDAFRFLDIKQFSYAIYKSVLRHYGIKDRSVNVISGGFPCQPYSTAGERKGTGDERHLWPEMLRIIREFQPEWVVGENVRGLVSWSAGLVFEQVCTDLEAAGYEVQPFLLPAASINAPHERYRIWFVAHRNGQRRKGQQSKGLSGTGKEQPPATPDKTGLGSIADTDSTRSQRRIRVQKPAFSSERSETTTNAHGINRRLPIQPQGRWIENKNPDLEWCSEVATNPAHIGWKWGGASRHWRHGFADCNPLSTNTNGSGCGQFYFAPFADQSGFRTGRSFDCWNEWTTEPPVCRMDDGIPRRVDRIKGLGNSIVPQLAYRIFTAINDYDNE